MIYPSRITFTSKLVDYNAAAEFSHCASVSSIPMPFGCQWLFARQCDLTRNAQVFTLTDKPPVAPDPSFETKSSTPFREICRVG